MFSLVFCLVPVVLDLDNQAVLVGSSGILSLNTLLLQVGAELIGIPVIVRRRNLGLPVVLDEVLKILSICGSRVWDIVVRQPSLKLGLVPFVVDYLRVVSKDQTGKSGGLDCAIETEHAI